MTARDWQRFASAPRDGTPFLAVRLDDDEGGDTPEWAACYLSTAGTLCFDLGSAVIDDWEPTHWQPLPDPPEPP